MPVLGSRSCNNDTLHSSRGQKLINETFLDHAELIMSLMPATLSTGQMSEEPAESCNKDVKNFQLDHCFQGDPIKRNLQLFGRMLDRSYPEILMWFVDRKLQKRAKEPIPPECIDVLADPNDVLFDQNVDSTPRRENIHCTTPSFCRIVSANNVSNTIPV